MTEFETDSELLDRIQTGKGDEDIYKLYNNIFVDLIFGGTTPEAVE